MSKIEIEIDHSAISWLENPNNEDAALALSVAAGRNGGHVKIQGKVTFDEAGNVKLRIEDLAAIK